MIDGGEIDDVYVCNAMLTMLGVDTINSISNPEDNIESVCARLYPLVRDSIFAKYEWKCSKPVVQLVSNADQPVIGGKKFAYRLPSDLIAGPFAVYADGDLSNSIPDGWINANNHIHSDYDRIDVLYRNIPPVKNWPAYLRDLIATALGARAAKPLTEDLALAQDLRLQAFGPPALDGNGGMFLEAKRIDAKTSTVKTIHQNGDPLSATRF